MKIVNIVAKALSVVLIVVLIIAVFYIANQQKEIAQLKTKQSKLSTSLADLKNAHKDCEEKINVEKQRAEAWQEESNNYKEMYEDYKVKLYPIDQRLEKSLVEMVYKHYKALEDGNKEAYMQTVTKNEYLMEVFESGKGTKRTITTIYAFPGETEEKIKQGGFFLNVGTKENGGDGGYGMAVTKVNGEWKVYDYD